LFFISGWQAGMKRSDRLEVTVYFNFFETLFSWILSGFHQVGDLSPKGRVGNSRLCPVSGRKSDSKTAGNTNFFPSTGASRLSPTRCFGETSPTF
jgi:hypothetical protein